MSLPTEANRRRRLLSESEAPIAADSNACSVEDVLQLLQLLYAISRDTDIDSNITGTALFESEKILPLKMKRR